MADYNWFETRYDLSPLERLEFHRVSDFGCYRQYYHKPCGLMFYFPNEETSLPKATAHTDACLMAEASEGKHKA